MQPVVTMPRQGVLPKHCCENALMLHGRDASSGFFDLPRRMRSGFAQNDNMDTLSEGSM
jgi:hypothetical protein